MKRQRIVKWTTIPVWGPMWLLWQFLSLLGLLTLGFLGLFFATHDWIQEDGRSTWRECYHDVMRRILE